MGYYTGTGEYVQGPEEHQTNDELWREGRVNIELVTSPVLCMYCKVKIREIVSPPDFPGAPSHGVCSACEPKMFARSGMSMTGRPERRVGEFGRFID